MNNIEDLETQEVLARHDERNRYEEIEINGRKTILRHRSMRYLFVIEQFVKAIEKEYEEKGKAKGIREWVGRDGFMKNEPYSLGKAYYGKLNEWIERYREGTRYSVHVEAFHDACKDLAILGGKKRFWFGELGDTDVQYDRSYADWFNELIVKIHERCQSRKFKERMRLIEAHRQRSFDRVIAFAEELFSEENGRASWLVIELTLQYESKYRGSITLDDVQKHRDKFFRARSYNKLMSCVKAYAWAIEEGEEVGFHLHVVLFCLPITKDDERLANQIGDYWADVVTEGGGGKYWNSNREDLKPGYETRGHGIGVGLIGHSDSKMRGSLRENLLYLAKSEQQLQIRAEGNVHTFGMSGVPKKVKAGRPRSASVGDVENAIAGRSDGMRLEDSVVRQGSASAVKCATSRLCKSDVSYPFPIETSLSAA
ncbi:inovirus-type Gp2 protein [Paraburkholderia bryophila]|uniref:hypothetical protein n=1 Tax=Paraburkholderia bryophila TaxID=420952 RepID=UPI0038BDA880